VPLDRGNSIIQAADYSPTYSGNFIASLSAAARQCRAHGYRTVWVLPAKAHAYPWFRSLVEDFGGSVYALPDRGTLAGDTMALRRIAMRENAAIIHTHFSSSDISAWFTKVLCTLESRNVQVFWHVHSAFTDISAMRRSKDFIKLGVLGRLCHVVPVSTALGEAVAARGCPRDRIHVIDNGIDIQHATAKQTSREEMRKAWAVPSGSLVMLGFGWTPIRKGVDTMLEALATLLREGRNLTLVLAGTEQLQKFIDDWPDRDCLARVRVIPPAEFVGDLFGASDIFLSPSRAEGWCYGVAEAMANEVPAIAGDIPPLNWARGADGVYFCTAGDSEALAASIRQVSDLSPVVRAITGELAKNFVACRYSVECWGSKIWDLYEQVLRPVQSSMLPASSK